MKELSLKQVKTYGLGRFFVYSKPACARLMLLSYIRGSCRYRQVYPVFVGQIVREEAKNLKRTKRKWTKRAKSANQGPKGSKTKINPKGVDYFLLFLQATPKEKALKSLASQNPTAPAGNCMVIQCKLPYWCTNGRQGVAISSRPGKHPAKRCKAISSIGSS
jgi:hypothetical protein